jgi:tRNA A-37 threonylcarbamoyl transferase component Bud32
VTAVRGRRNLIVVATVGIAVVVGAGIWTHASLKREVERWVHAELWAVAATAARGATTFLTGAERLTGVAAQTPEVRAQAGHGGLYRALAPYFGGERPAVGYLATDARGTVLEASGGALASRGEVLSERICPVAAVARERSPRAGQPFRARDGRVYLLVVSPVPDSAVFLALAFDNQELTAPLLAARVGGSGETYAVDARGVMISSSRFAQQLRDAGMSGVGAGDSTFGIELRDPGGDVTDGYRPAPRNGGRPLTVAVGRVTAGGDGVSLTPYPDYRGVPVVGAWTWVAARGFGIISEVDAAEAFRPLRVLERIFAVLLALLAVAAATTVMGWLLAQRAAQRALRAEAVARRMGQYVVERQLGSGATGDVYLARHVLLRRPTALKLLREQRSDPQSLERFEREVQVTASMVHPHIVAIYDYGRTDDGLFFYAMEYLDGMDLERFVTRFGPCPDARVIHILRQICDSLGAAHARGLVHRDIKPSNVFVCRAGVPDLVKVLDFGLVRVAGSQTVTTSGAVLGTPATMAPELYESAENAGVASDIYAIGCVGYFLLTGRHVFAGASLAELCNAHLSKTPVHPSVRLGRAVDDTLERALLGCLAKLPGGRPRSAAALAALLAESAAQPAWSRADAAAFWAAHADAAPDAAAEPPPSRRTLRAAR